MSREQVLEGVKKLAAHHFDVDVETITEETDIVKNLDADSISIMEFILELEDEFDLTISDDDAEGITTIAQIVDYIQK
jgi:acyl carrier protein